MQNKLKKVKKYIQFLSQTMYANERDIDNISICLCEYKRNNEFPPLEKFVPYRQGDPWGSGLDSHAWFHFSIDIPQEMKGEPIQLFTDAEQVKTIHDLHLLIYVNGEFRQGLDRNHPSISLDGLDNVDVYIYAYTGQEMKESSLYAKIRNVNRVVEQLYYDVKTPLEMLDYLDSNSYEYIEILKHLNNAVSLLNIYEVGDKEFFESVSLAKKYMDEEFYGKFCSVNRGLSYPTTVGIGHTHIDCAYHWTLKQTREKVQRSFGIVLELMKQYPEYKFMSSQALLYKFFKEECPERYDEIKERIKEGRWECEGAMWVESDCNLPSGESLVRQIMYGKRFFKQEFGVENHILWLPDVFGYSAALPQILKKSGVDWFVTSKISWNDTNTMPYDTFLWEGIDGTQINTYFLTGQEQNGREPVRRTTYSGNTSVKMISGTWNRYKGKNLNNEVLLPFGFGDGGGGPTSDMLEMARRSGKGITGAPLFKIEFVDTFFQRLESKIQNNPLLPKWNGELYLEFHRGTYTTMAKNKRNNRKAEFTYLFAEFIASVDKYLNNSVFPKNDLHQGWELILTNQFHDIIPGSSIRVVYEQSELDYKEIFDIGNGIVKSAENSIASKLDKKGGYVVFNPHSFAGEGVVVVDGKTSIIPWINSKGYLLTNRFISKNNIVIDDDYVETNCFKVKFDKHKQIVSIFDKKNNREVLKNGCVGNEIRIYADRTDTPYDAWEWAEFSLDKYQTLDTLNSCKVVEDGARKGVRIERRYKASKIIQTIWFWDNIPKIDFDTYVDWHQQHIMLKAAFPVDINATKATYEIQFGTLERPTHKNTSWDRSKFEVCAHKYADLSEGDYGVSLINDCKYGHDIHDGVMVLSLLRSPTHPNEVADQGEMVCSYSICPHKGQLNDSETVKYAYYLNYPLQAVKASGNESSIPERYSAISIDKDNVICETIKESEDGADTVIRLYEYKNCRSNIKISTSIPYTKAVLCDLMENEICELGVDNGDILTTIKGFEILTIKLKNS